MIHIHADQLATHLQESLYHAYFLCGNELLLLQESQDRIRARAKREQFDEHFSVTLQSSTDWEVIFSLCQARRLFTKRQTLLLVLPEEDMHAEIEEKLLQLASLLHEDMLLILRSNKITQTLKNGVWFKAFKHYAVLVNCTPPEAEQLPNWVARRAKSAKLTLDEAACHLLCYSYEGNLLALVQTLDRLALTYPDGNLTLRRVKGTVNDEAHFTQLHWVDAVLAGKSKRAVHILRQLRLEVTDPLLLLRSIQREVLQLLVIKRKMPDALMGPLFDRHQIWKNRRLLLTQALGRLTLAQLRDGVALMLKIELALKQDHDYPAWSDLNMLTVLLCGNAIPTAMFDG